MNRISKTSAKRRGAILSAIVFAAASGLSACVTVAPGNGGGGGGGGGGIGVNPPPSYTPQCTQRVGSNGGQGFWDIGLGRCFSCPAGSDRTIFDVRSNQACQSGGPFGPMMAAEDLGS